MDDQLLQLLHGLEGLLNCQREKKKAQDPKSLGQPLRTVLFSSWLTAIKYRVKEFTSNPSLKDQAINMGIFEDGGFPCLQWDPEASEHVRTPQEGSPMMMMMMMLMMLMTMMATTSENDHHEEAKKLLGMMMIGKTLR